MKWTPFLLDLIFSNLHLGAVVSHLGGVVSHLGGFVTHLGPVVVSSHRLRRSNEADFCSHEGGCLGL